MRKLAPVRRPGRRARAAVVVPNGTLFGDGVCARIKEELLKEFNLHTIVRLPNGVFAPYTSIPTNLLFFDRSGPTKEIWYYEQPLPEGRKNYTKTQPIQFEEFADCIAWWTKRKENDQAWKVPVADIAGLRAATSTARTRVRRTDFEHLPPEQLADDILQKELRIAEIDAGDQGGVRGEYMNVSWRTAPMGDVAPLVRRPVQPKLDELYREIGIRSFGNGIFHKAPITGLEIGDKRVFAVEPGDLLFNIVFAWEGAIAVASEAEQGMIGSHRFLTCVSDKSKADARFLNYWFMQAEGRDQLLRASPGGCRSQPDSRGRKACSYPRSHATDRRAAPYRGAHRRTGREGGRGTGAAVAIRRRHSRLNHKRCRAGPRGTDPSSPPPCARFPRESSWRWNTVEGCTAVLGRRHSVENAERYETSCVDRRH